MQTESQATQSEVLDSYKPYNFQQILKHSGTGFIYIIESQQSPEPLVLKIIPLSHLQDPNFEEQKKNAEEEYANMLLLALHPGFVKPIDGVYYENSGHGFFDILMEHCGRSISDIKFEKACPLEARIDWMKQVIEAMAYAESKNIYHGDLKPQNLMLKNDTTVKLIDLGGSRSLGATTYAKTIVQVTKKVKELTPCYAALELLEGRDPIIMNKLDVYAFGKTFYEIFYNKSSRDLDQERMKLCGTDPNSRFIRTNEEEYNAWLNDLLTRILPDDSSMKFSKVLNQIIYMCLQYRPDKRPSFAELRAFVDSQLQPLILPAGLPEAQDRSLAEDAPATVKYAGRPKPEDEEIKENEPYINPYEEFQRLVHVYSELRLVVVVNLQGEGGFTNVANVHGMLIGKETETLPAMAQCVMTGADRVLFLGGKFELTYSGAMYEVVVKERPEERKSGKGRSAGLLSQGYIIAVNKKKAALRTPRVLFGLVHSKDNVYVLGGSTVGEKLLRDCEVYSVNDNTVKEMPPMSEPKEGVATCLYQDKWLYAFGGRYQNFEHGSNMLDNFSNKIEQYDVQNRSWTVIVIKPESGYHGSASSGAAQTARGQILIFGGIFWQKQVIDPHLDIKAAEETEQPPTNMALTFETMGYEVRTRTFAAKEDCPQTIMCTAYFGATYAVRGRVYAFNAVVDRENEFSVYMYDTQLKDWRVQYFVSKPQQA